MDSYSVSRDALLELLLIVMLAPYVIGQSFIQPVFENQPLEQIPQSYQFGYDFGDGLGMTQYRQESADDNGFVQGSYGYRDPLGVYRKVEYNAGNDGFRAIVFSNEPGLTSHVAANAPYSVQAPPAAAVAQAIRQVPVIRVIKK